MRHALTALLRSALDRDKNAGVTVGLSLKHMKRTGDSKRVKVWVSQGCRLGLRVKAMCEIGDVHALAHVPQKFHEINKPVTVQG